VELLSVPDSTVQVIYPIVSPIFTHLASKRDEEVLIRYNLLQPYILFVATIEPRKNLMRLLEAYDRTSESFRKDVRLVLVGRKGWKSEEIVRAILAHRRADRVCWLQKVSDAELSALYRRALMFVYPSLYEGFGYPVAEALACGTPVIASRVASLPEIAGDAAVLVEPGDVEALSAAMESLADDGAKRRRLQRRGPEQVRQFSSQHAVEKILSLYKTLA
jgi:glycosyltransferase involved in cell wall biosynthesis